MYDIVGLWLLDSFPLPTKNLVTGSIRYHGITIANHFFLGKNISVNVMDTPKTTRNSDAPLQSIIVGETRMVSGYMGPLP